MCADGSVIFDPILDDLYACYYTNEEGKKVRVYLYQSMIWNEENKCWEFIPREFENNLKINVTFKQSKKEEKENKDCLLLSLFRKNK